MAVPKKRKSSSKSRMRRASNLRTKIPQLSLCPSCGLKKKPHRVCLNCGFYKEQVVINPDKFTFRFK